MGWMPKYTITKGILTDLTKIEAVKNSFNDKPLSPILLSSLHKTAKISQTHYSTQIEGNRLTLEQVENALYSANKTAQNYQGHDEKEVKAYYNAINYMEKYLDSDSAFSLDFVQKIHSLVEGSKKNIPYRDAQNAIYDSSDGSLVYLPPEAKDVPTMMQDLIQWVQDNIDKLPTPIVAGLFHYQFVTIHPYFDGNGRMARLLHMWYLIQKGYESTLFVPLSSYIERSRKKYYDSFTLIEENHKISGIIDITPFLKYYSENVYDKISKEEVKPDTLAKYGELLQSGEITVKEAELWQFVLSAYAGKPFTTKQLEKDFAGAAFATIRKFVLKFTERGLLTATKLSNKVLYAVKN